MMATAKPRPVPAGEDQVLMQAIVQRQYGTVPEDVFRLERIARPAVAPGEVLVRVHAAGVDRGTWHAMAGLPYLGRIALGLRAPKIPVPGMALAGTVEAVGQDVTSLKPGDEVFGCCRGSFAEYTVARADKLAAKPAGLTFGQAAALPVSATTALRAVRDKGRVQPGQHVLVIGASGGVGTFAVQIAKALGAEVTGGCSTAKTDLVAAIGADHVLDYTREDPVSGQPRYDVIIDIGGNRPLAHLRRALSPRGTLVITGGEDGGAWLGGMGRNFQAQLRSPFVGQSLTAPLVLERQADLISLRDLVGSGAVSPAIDRTYPLSQAAAAVRHLAEGRARGKLVITL